MKSGKEDIGTLPCALVEWIDSAGLANWSDRAFVKKKEPTPIRSVGILVANDKTRITLAQSEGLDDDGLFDHIIVIPRRCVTKIKVLKL